MTNCLKHLKICKAECCKQFKLTLPPDIRIYKGQTLSWIEDNKDMINYFKCHGAYVYNGKMYLKLNRFKRVGNVLTIHQPCLKLKDNLCVLHNTPDQPKICQYPNKDFDGTLKGIYLTPNCIYNESYQRTS